jgi:L-ascorbate metabolism protein UlaG (beta-lactamase superfamily)
MPPNLEASDHFRRGRFFNPGVPDHSFSQFLKWITRRKIGPWRKFVCTTPGPKPPPRISGDDLLVTFVNHATLLLQSNGFNFLTDPVWSKRVSPISFLGPQRHRDPGVRFEDLPQIDCILISHNHYDHLDLPTLKRLSRRDHPAIFCPLGVGKLLRKAGFQEIYELDWWQTGLWKNLQFHCVPAQHFSARTPFDRNRTLWCGWVLGLTGGHVYFAGDTGFGEHFAAIAARFQRLRLSILPIGAFKPEWFMGPVHMTPEQAVEAQRILESPIAVAMHFGTFALADDGEFEPTDRLRACLTPSEQEGTFWVLNEGEGRRVPRIPVNSVFADATGPKTGVETQR